MVREWLRKAQTRQRYSLNLIAERESAGMESGTVVLYGDQDRLQHKDRVRIKCYKAQI